MKSKQIIFSDEGISSIFFSPGRPEDGGTCAYATDECLEECLSYLVQNEHTENTLAFFKEHGVETIVSRILQEIKTKQVKLFEWNTWGDCLPELEEKVSQAIMELHKAGIVQYGFTRNIQLWWKVPTNPILRLHLTVDNHNLAKRLSIYKPTSTPDFKEGETHLYFDGHHQGMCGTSWCEWENGKTVIRDCKVCFRAGQGCFYRPVKEVKK